MLFRQPPLYSLPFYEQLEARLQRINITRNDYPNLFTAIDGKKDQEISERLVLIHNQKAANIEEGLKKHAEFISNSEKNILLCAAIALCGWLCPSQCCLIFGSTCASCHCLDCTCRLLPNKREYTTSVGHYLSEFEKVQAMVKQHKESTETTPLLESSTDDYGSSAPYVIRIHTP